MKGMIWNSDGFGDTAKHWFVKEIIREEKLDFVGLIETGRADFASHFLTNLASEMIWYYLPPQGRSGGILVAFNSMSIVVQKVIASDNLLGPH